MQKSKIVFLDAGTIDLGDINFASLKKLGEVRFFEQSASEELIERCKEASIVITNKCVFSRKVFLKLPLLKLLCVSATGYNNIDIQAAKERKIIVTNVRGYSTSTVVEHTLLFLLSFSHRLIEHHQASLSGEWSQSPYYTLLKFPFSELQGKVLGIIGYGTIGKQVAKLAKNLKMKVLIAKIPGKKYSDKEKRISLEEVLKKSDFISLHSALTKETFHLMNEKRILMLKKSAYLLNLARGDLVDEKAMVRALRANKIAGYATDLMSQEPPSLNHPFFQASLRDKVLITPHIAWASRESRQRLIDEVAKNILAFQRGKKRNQVI